MSAKFLQFGVPFLEGITEEHAQYLDTLAQRQTFSKGHTILFRGTTVDGLHVIDGGSVEVLVKPPKGKVPVQVATLGPGDVFGETSIVEMTTAGATIKALEDDTSIVIIPQEAFRKVMSENPEFKARALALIESRKKKTSDAVRPPEAVAAA